MMMRTLDLQQQQQEQQQQQQLPGIDPEHSAGDPFAYQQADQQPQLLAQQQQNELPQQELLPTMVMMSMHEEEAEFPTANSGSPFVGYGQPPENAKFKKETTSAFRKDAVQGLYIGVFAILGALVRMMTAQYFGEECANPGTVGWMASGSPLCVTSSGGATEQGGIIFADLPANMLGSFVMGFFASCTTLKLATSSNMQIPWLPPNHPFQQMSILHKAVTTGFCGSLTTFSGWNSSMVVLLFGTGSVDPTHTCDAIFGYIIGMEVAVGCFVAGKSLSRRLYRIVNPILASESDAMRVRRLEGVHMNPDLPDFERRFLPDLDMGYKGEKDYGFALPMARLDYLAQWRESTKPVRRVNHPLLPSLITIEKAILVDFSPVPTEAESLAHMHGWNIAALREWQRAKGLEHHQSLPSVNSSGLRHVAVQSHTKLTLSPGWFTIPFAAGLFGAMMGILLALFFILHNNENSYNVTYHTMVYSMLFAPFGAILRWEFSAWNAVGGGSVFWPEWTWFPLGTFTANLIGSVMSISAIALEYKYPAKDSFLFETMRAMKIGFVGSLTTVSTFVAEVHGFVIENTDYAYPYMLTTLGCCCSFSCLVYAVILYGF